MKASTRSSAMLPSKGQPKAVAMVPFKDAPVTVRATSAKPRSEASQSMRMFCRLWVSLAEKTRFSSSAPAATARSAPLRLGTSAA
jgi:hypothetical protein